MRKSEKLTMDKGKQDKDDWENDDWDDWNDAEDNFQDAMVEPDEKAQKESNIKSKEENVQHATTTNHNDNNSNNDNNNGSWTNMLRLGGVVSSITSTVSQVMGVPDPEELARIDSSESSTKEQQTHGSIEQEKEETTETTSAFGLGLVSGVTNLGSKVLFTGLDALEGIGKKTMHILQENDPLLKNKRKLLGLDSDRPNLSALLKEAKDDADQWESTLKNLQIEKARSALHFETLFENNCGLVHLEALEILSKESTLKLNKLLDAVSGQALRELKETVNEVKELMDMEELDGESNGDYTAEELKDWLTNAIEDTDIKISFDDIVTIWSQTLTWLEEESQQSNEEEQKAEEIFVRGITTLAETCALEMNKLHKIAEILLVKEHHSTANEVDGIVQLCKQFYIHLNGLTNRFATRLTITAGNTEANKTLLSTLFSEMLQATQHIDKAMKLFLPIIQIGAA